MKDIIAYVFLNASIVFKNAAFLSSKMCYQFKTGLASFSLYLQHILIESFLQSGSKISNPGCRILFSLPMIGMGGGSLFFHYYPDLCRTWFRFCSYLCLHPEYRLGNIALVIVECLIWWVSLYNPIWVINAARFASFVRFFLFYSIQFRKKRINTPAL